MHSIPTIISENEKAQRAAEEKERKRQEKQLKALQPGDHITWTERLLVGDTHREVLFSGKVNMVRLESLTVDAIEERRHVVHAWKIAKAKEGQAR